MAVTFPVFIVGTRAQLIKVAPVMRAVAEGGLPTQLLLTGQHQETMHGLLEEFGVRIPQQALLAGERATVGALLGWLPRAFLALVRALNVLRSQHGSVSVIVHGDTVSTIVGAVAGACSGCTVMHLESGLSSGKLFDPFPEELARRIVFRLTDVAFCPSREAAAYMSSRFSCQVVNTGGNTIVDAVRLAGVAPGRVLEDGPYVVASLHRAQNIFSASRLRHLVDLIEVISRRYQVHFVLHPATRKRLIVHGLLPRLKALPGVRLLPRMGYRDFLKLAANAGCVLTDGGSNQEELSILGVPTIIMRERTERPDGLGRNAILEADISGGVEAFVLGGRHEALRHIARPLADEGPSQTVARFLGATKSQE